MKMFVSMILVLASAAAFATPTVGDHSVFSVKIEQNGAYSTGTYDVSLIGLDSSGGFKMKSVVTLEDQQPQTKEEVVEAKNLPNDQQIQDALTNCVSMGGVSNSTAVQGTTYPTCVLPTEDGEVHIAAVPFGLVMQIQTDANTGRKLTLTLQSFEFGK